MSAKSMWIAVAILAWMIPLASGANADLTAFELRCVSGDCHVWATGYHSGLALVSGYLDITTVEAVDSCGGGSTCTTSASGDGPRYICYVATAQTHEPPFSPGFEASQKCDSTP